MKLNKTMAKLVCDLEYLIGGECYNPNSYDGWTGDEGCGFRYPVYVYPDKTAEEPMKIRGNVADRVPDISPEAISTMKYKFGSNHLFIGEGIVKILNELETRYGIDFNELETQNKKK